MNDLYFAIATLLFCTLGYFLSWQQYCKGEYRIALALLLLCGLALRLYTASDGYLHQWDERYHALVAKHLMQHPFYPSLYEENPLAYDFKNWTANHIWLHKQPLALWAMAASMKIFGINEFAIRIPSILLSTAAIGICYKIGRFFYNQKVAYLGAFFLSINGLIIEMTGGRAATDHIDLFFMFFIALAILCSILFVEKGKSSYNLLAGLSIGLAVLSKWLPALIVLPIWLLLVIDAQKWSNKQIVFQFLLMLAVCMLTFLPWQIYIHQAFPLEARWEASFNVKHFNEVIEQHSGSWHYFLDKIRINYGELIYLPLLWLLWQIFQKPKDKKQLALLIWIAVPLLFFSLAQTKMQAYVLFTAPALFLISAAFYFRLYNFMLQQQKGKWFFKLLLMAFIALPIRYMIERVKPFNHSERKPDWVLALKRLNNKQISKGILFNYDKPIEAMFYTQLIAYPNLPEPSKIKELMADGYTIVVKDDAHISEEIKSIKGILIMQL